MDSKNPEQQTSSLLKLSKMPKMFAGKNLRMTQKKVSRTDSFKKDLTRCVKNRCVRSRYTQNHFIMA